jgi:DNA-binding transcriptional regulator/RsmH inhibitor MraZ
MCPVEVRQQITPEVHGKDFFLVVGSNRRPWLWCDKHYESLIKEQPSTLTSRSEIQDFYRLSLGTAQKVELDGQNRILIPVRSMDWTGLQQKKDFYLVGVKSHLEVWDDADWENERKALRERAPELTDRFQ